jgi:mannose-6-phosphate isomerase-like protein (cupin superfamily)
MILDQARTILAAAFAPLSPDHFFDTYMGQTVFDLPGEPNAVRQLLLGADPKQTILNAFATRADQLAAHAHAPTGPMPRPLPVSNAAEFHASIKQFHERGYTVRVPAVTSLSPALHQFTRALEFMLHQPVKASLFWSAEGARAPIHYDDNDNIVIQLSGRKRWLISSDPPSLHNAWRDVAEEAVVLGDHRTIDLEPGSLLYIPRGTPHTVLAQSESLHLAITFTPVTLREVMIAALDHLSDYDRPIREHAIGRIDAQLDMIALSQRVRGAIARLHEASRSPEFLASALKRRASRTIGNMERLSGGTTAPSLSVSSAVRHTPLAMCHMLATPTMIDFCQPGEHINVHRGVESALRFIGATPSFRVSDLPGDLSEDVRIALVNRLIISGFLELDD